MPPREKDDVLQGTLDMLVLKTLELGDLSGPGTCRGIPAAFRGGVELCAGAHHMRFELMAAEATATVKIGRLHGLTFSLHTLRVGAQIELRRTFALQPSAHLQHLDTIATG